MKKTRTASFHPQMGWLSSSTKTISTLITSYISENQHPWDEYLAVLMMGYRATPHESTGSTPYEPMLGREVHMPIDIQVGQPLEEQKGPEHESEENLRIRPMIWQQRTLAPVWYVKDDTII